MRASGIPLKARYDPPERREYTDRRKGKEAESSSAGQEPLTLEEVTMLFQSMANNLTKVKQGQFAHSFLGPAPRPKISLSGISPSTEEPLRCCKEKTGLKSRISRKPLELRPTC